MILGAIQIIRDTFGGGGHQMTQGEGGSKIGRKGVTYYLNGHLTQIKRDYRCVTSSIFLFLGMAQTSTFGTTTRSPCPCPPTSWLSSYPSWSTGIKFHQQFY